MAVGDRIKRVRNFRKMTMKELGMAVGFDGNSADVRIAQYENNSRKPKEELLRKIARALDVSYYSLAEPTSYCAEDILFTLFELEAQGSGLHLLNVVSVKPTGADRAKNGAESIILRAKLVFTDSTEHSMAAAAVHPVPDSLPVLFAEYGADTYTDQVCFPSRFQSC